MERTGFSGEKERRKQEKLWLESSEHFFGNLFFDVSIKGLQVLGLLKYER